MPASATGGGQAEAEQRDAGSSLRPWALSYEVARTCQHPELCQGIRERCLHRAIYTNVESVNAEFTDLHFGTRDGVLVKGNPAQVDLNGRTPSLSDAPGGGFHILLPL